MDNIYKVDFIESRQGTITVVAPNKYMARMLAKDEYWYGEGEIDWEDDGESTIRVLNVEKTS